MYRQLVSESEVYRSKVTLSGARLFGKSLSPTLAVDTCIECNY